MYRRTSSELSGEYFGYMATSSGIYDIEISKIWFIVKFYRIEMAVCPLHNKHIHRYKKEQISDDVRYDVKIKAKAEDIQHPAKSHHSICKLGSKSSISKLNG